jgi:hypothetical protein
MESNSLTISNLRLSESPRDGMYQQLSSPAYRPGKKHVDDEESPSVHSVVEPEERFRGDVQKYAVNTLKASLTTTRSSSKFPRKSVYGLVLCRMAIKLRPLQNSATPYDVNCVALCCCGADLAMLASKQYGSSLLFSGSHTSRKGRPAVRLPPFSRPDLDHDSSTPSSLASPHPGTAVSHLSPEAPAG